MSKVLVIGGGPAGCFAAIAAAEQGHQVVLLERNEKIGKKLFITGKGRCNLTNACDTEELFSNIPRNSKFLYSAIYSYDNFRVMDFFEQNGTPVKVERGNRVFPVSDHSSDVIAALKRSLDAHKVKIMYHTTVEKLMVSENCVHGVITAEGKKMPADASGVRIAQIDEPSYRRLLWDHRPLTDFWRVGRGYARKLEKCGIYTMGDIARCSLGKPEEYYNEELLYRLFGINAELLIDHAWGWEPCTIADIKAYKPEAKSISSGQVLKCPYPCGKARLIVQEMTDLLVLELVEKGYVTDQLVLTIGYDIDNLTDPVILKKYHGEITTDRYGRRVPKHAHGTENLEEATSSTKRIMEGMLSLYDRIINPDLLIRRITVVAAHLQREQDVMQEETYEQMDLFTDYEQKNKEKQEKEEERRKEKQIQKAILNVQKKYGKNALIKGMSLQEGATTMERNRQIGGHKA